MNSESKTFIHEAHLPNNRLSISRAASRTKCPPKAQPLSSNPLLHDKFPTREAHIGLGAHNLGPTHTPLYSCSSLDGHASICRKRTKEFCHQPCIFFIRISHKERSRPSQCSDPLHPLPPHTPRKILKRSSQCETRPNGQLLTKSCFETKLGCGQRKFSPGMGLLSPWTVMMFPHLGENHAQCSAC